MIKYQVTQHISKSGKPCYFLDVYIIYNSGKRFKLCSTFIKKYQYELLKEVK